MMLSLEEVAVDVDTLMPSLGVKSFLLLDVDSQQSAATGCYRHYQGRNRSEEHIEKDEPQERNPESSSGNHDEPATDSHEFKGHLQPLEHGIATIVYLHSPVGLIAEELRQCGSHGNQGGTTTDGHHDGLLENLPIICKCLIHSYIEKAETTKGTKWEQKIQKPQNENIYLTNLNMENNGNFPILSF